MANQPRRVDCIIPFYNEGERVVHVISVLSQVPECGRIIAVDDGSSDGIGRILARRFPHLILVRLSKNAGKSAAVFAGLSRAKSPDIFLLDADSERLFPATLSSAIHAYEESGVDSLILRKHGPWWIRPADSLFRNYVVQAGERLMRRNDLSAVRTLHPVGYQLEVAINQYLMEQRKKCAWMYVPIRNPHKVEKYGWREGWRRDLLMEKSITEYLGPRKQIQQILFFCRHQISTNSSNKIK